jgi:hypothetical protein
MTSDRRSHPDLENHLRALAATIEVPPPDYADRVLQRLADPTDVPRLAVARPGPGPSTATRRFVAAAAVLLVAAAVTIAVPSSRQAVASWFAFRGVDVRSGPSQSLPLPVDPVTPAPLAAGSRVTLDQAQRATTDRVRVPADLAPPDRVFLRRDGAAVIVTIAYRTASTLRATSGTGYALLLTEIFDAGEPVLQKILEEAATATAVQVNGRSGVFIAGPQQVVMLDHSRTSHGQPTLHEVSARASANTLIWGDGGTTYRLEGDFTQPVALTLSEGLR